MTLACLSFTAVPHQLTQVRAHGGHKTRDRSPRRHDTAIFPPFVCILSAFSHSDIGPTMTTSLNEKTSNEERKDIWFELQSFRHDTLALRTEAYRLRTAGHLDATANERLRTQQTELERRGEAIIKRCVHFLCLLSGTDGKNTDFRPRSNGRPVGDQVRSKLPPFPERIDR